MKRGSVDLGSSEPSNKKIRISKSEVQTLIKQEVHSAMRRNKSKLDCLIEKIQQELKYESAINKLEAHINGVKQRGNATLASITKLNLQSSAPSLLPVALDSSRSDSEDKVKKEIVSNHKNCTNTSDGFLQTMEDTRKALKKMKEDNEAQSIQTLIKGIKKESPDRHECTSELEKAKWMDGRVKVECLSPSNSPNNADPEQRGEGSDSDPDSESESIDSEEEAAFADGKDPLLDIDDEAPECLFPVHPPPVPKAAVPGLRASAAPAKWIRESTDTSEPRWMNREDEDELPRQFPFCPRRTPGPQLDAQKDYSPKELFQLFFTRNVLNTLCANTNKNIRRKRTEGQKPPITEVNPELILKFISLVIYLGLVKPSAMRDLWRKDRVHCRPFPASVMPCWKFEAIMSLLHMSDPEEDTINDQLKGTPDYDALFRIRPLHDQILEACRAHYHPFQNIAIDERMVASKSNHSMKQNMKEKPTKWAFKLFVLADSRNGYTCNFSIYQRKTLTLSGNGLSFDSVVNLIQVPLLGTGYHVYLDNFHDSAFLFRHLYSMNYAACGTIRETWIGYPRTKRNSLPKNAERGDMRWIRDDGLLFVKWRDTRDIGMCSTIHKAHSGQTVQRRVWNSEGSWCRRAVPVPDAVLDYNRYMGGVDLSDALIKYYTVIQRTMQWYKKFFFHFVDIAIANSFIIQKELAQARNKTPLTLKSFREQLCLELSSSGGNSGRDAGPRPGCSQTPPEPRPQTAEVKPRGCFPVPVVDVTASDLTQRATKGRKYCVHCLALKRQNKTIYKCRSCNVPLCIIPDRVCFTEWHDLKQTEESQSL